MKTKTVCNGDVIRSACCCVILLVLTRAGMDVFASDPDAGPPTKMPELRAGAQIARDHSGVAHIIAQNEHDLFFLQGYVHAQDRLFQMDVNRRLASGTLAELLGAGALAQDVQLRTIGLRRAAERSLAVQSSRVRAALDAYAEGVNAWADSHPLPPEYAALELTQVAPWTPVDTLTVVKVSISEILR